MHDPLISIEAEAALLGALMLPECERLIEMASDRLAAHDFAEPVHGRIYSAILDQRAFGKSANPMVLRPLFENDEAMKELGGVGYLARLTADRIGLLAPIDLADQVADLGRRRRMRAGLSAATLACSDFKLTTLEIAAAADTATQPEDDEKVHDLSGGECIDELLASYREPSTGTTCRALPSINDLLGPMRPKQLIIGAGRPGMGKTALALSYALGAAQAGHGVLFVSLEMASIETAPRLVSDFCFDENDGGVPFARIRDGHLSEQDMRRVRDARDRLHALPLQIADVGSLTITALNRLVRRHARRFAARQQKLELVVVDYLQLISPDQRGRSSYETISEVSRGLKILAKEQGVAVFALAQLSREVEKRPDKRPQLSDLRDSGQIEQDADAVLFLVRQEYYHRLTEPDEGSPKHYDWKIALEAIQGEVEFICAKRRNGRTGTAKGRFYGAFQAVRG